QEPPRKGGIKRPAHGYGLWLFSYLVLTFAVPASRYRSTAKLGYPTPGMDTSRSRSIGCESNGGRSSSIRQVSDWGVKPVNAARTFCANTSTLLEVVCTIVTPSRSHKSRDPSNVFDSNEPTVVHNNTYGYAGCSSSTSIK